MCFCVDIYKSSKALALVPFFVVVVLYKTRIIRAARGAFAGHGPTAQIGDAPWLAPGKTRSPLPLAPLMCVCVCVCGACILNQLP